MNLFLNYKLKPHQMELNFRSGNYEKNRKRTISILQLTAVIIVCFVFIDYNLITNIKDFSISLVGRIFAEAAIFFGIYLIKNFDEKYFDKILFFVVFIIIIHLFAVDYARQLDYVTIVSWDIFVIFSIYTAIPLSLFFQISTSMFLSFGKGVMWLYVKSPQWHELEMISIFGVYLFSNIFGILVSWEIKTYQRKQFILLINEREAKNNLEKVISEIKILRGILPICSFCNKIRNDSGYYERVDEYITKHSEADFSHTICPECFSENYPELASQSHDDHSLQQLPGSSA